MMSSFWISQGAPNPVTDVLMRGRRGEDIDTRERALKEGQRLEFVSHKPKKPLGTGRGKGQFFPRAFRGSRTLTTLLISGF